MHVKPLNPLMILDLNPFEMQATQNAAINAQ